MPEPLSLTEWEALGEAGQDALMAEAVMGWEPLPDGWWKRADRCRVWVGPARNRQAPDVPAWSPTTSDADACAVMDRMTALGWQYRLEGPIDGDPGVGCGFRRGYMGAWTDRAVAEMKGQAICLAAARAVGAVA